MSSQTATTNPAVDSGSGSSPTSPLPVVHDLKIVTLLSLLIALLTALASVAGLFFQDDIYPSDELQQSFVANDVVNLVLGLPVLLGSIWLTRRGYLLGLLFWPGALFYGLYNYLVYLLGMPFNAMYPFYLLIVTFSIYGTIGLVASINSPTVKVRLAGKVPEKLSGAILAVFGVLFMLLAASGIAAGLVSESELARPELALQTTDFIICFAWIIGGVLLWRRQALGYVSGTGLLFQASMLFVGLFAILMLQPLIGDTPLALVDILTIAALSLVSFIPLGIFLRGVLSAESATEAGAGRPIE